MAKSTARKSGRWKAINQSASSRLARHSVALPRHPSGVDAQMPAVRGGDRATGPARAGCDGADPRGRHGLGRARGRVGRRANNGVAHPALRAVGIVRWRTFEPMLVN